MSVCESSNITIQIDESKPYCKCWERDPNYKYENYDFYTSLNESYQSNETELKIATQIYIDFTEYLKQQLTPDEIEHIENTSYINASFDRDDDLTHFQSGFNIAMILHENELEELGITEQQKIYLVFTDAIQHEGITQGRNIFLKCNTKNGYITLGSIKKIFEIPDILIHEIQHALDNIRSKYRCLDQNVKKSFRSTTEMHAYRNNLIWFLNDLRTKGYDFSIDVFRTKERFMGFLKDLLVSEKYMMINQSVLRVLYTFLNSITPKDYKEIIKDIAEYFQEKLKNSSEE